MVRIGRRELQLPPCASLLPSSPCLTQAPGPHAPQAEFAELEEIDGGGELPANRCCHATAAADRPLPAAARKQRPQHLARSAWEHCETWAAAPCHRTPADQGDRQPKCWQSLPLLACPAPPAPFSLCARPPHPLAPSIAAHCSAHDLECVAPQPAGGSQVRDPLLHALHPRAPDLAAAGGWGGGWGGGWVGSSSSWRVVLQRHWLLLLPPFDGLCVSSRVRHSDATGSFAGDDSRDPLEVAAFSARRRLDNSAYNSGTDAT